MNSSGVEGSLKHLSDESSHLAEICVLITTRNTLNVTVR